MRAKVVLILTLFTLANQPAHAESLREAVWQDFYRAWAPITKKIVTYVSVAAAIGITAWVVWHRKTLSSYLFFGPKFPTSPDQAVSALEKAYEHDLNALLNLKKGNFFRTSFTLEDWCQVSKIQLMFGSNELKKRWSELQKSYLDDFSKAITLNKDAPTVGYYKALGSAAHAYGQMLGFIKDQRSVHDQQLNQMWAKHEGVLLGKLLQNTAGQRDCDALQALIDQQYAGHPILPPLREFKQFLTRHIATQPDPAHSQEERRRAILCSVARYSGEITIHLQ